LSQAGLCVYTTEDIADSIIWTFECYGTDPRSAILHLELPINAKQTNPILIFLFKFKMPTI